MYQNDGDRALAGAPEVVNPIPGAARLANTGPENLEKPVDVKMAAEFLGVSTSLVYAYVERKQIPHFRMMGRAIRFRLSELDSWRQQFHVNGGINE